jgi:competence protein ComEA
VGADKLNRFWFFITLILTIIIIISGITIWVKHDDGQPIQFITPQNPALPGMINIDGAVTNPGIYPLKSGDGIDTLIEASGGLAENADPSKIQLRIPRTDENSQPQKININRAEPWLLESLPNIGAVKAKAIVDYRNQNGPFQNIKDLTKVSGISSSILETIRDYVTVAD